MQYAQRLLFPTLPTINHPTNHGLAIVKVAYARCHLDWARKNLETWTEAKDEVDKIVAR